MGVGKGGPENNGGVVSTDPVSLDQDRERRRGNTKTLHESK